MGRSGRSGNRARGVLPQSMIDKGWPYVADLDHPEKGLGMHHGSRRDAFLRDRDWKRGSIDGRLSDTIRVHFRHEADADAYVAEFADLNAKRVVLPERRRKRGPYDFS